MITNEEGGNRLIQEFMGWKLEILDREETDPDFQFYVFIRYENGVRKEMWDGEEMECLSKNSTMGFLSWNRIMPVLEKIGTTISKSGQDDYVYNWELTRDGCVITEHDAVDVISISEDLDLTLLENTWKAVVEFIEFYNNENE